MNTEPQELQTILLRVRKLERENTRLKRIGAVVLLVGSITLLMGQSKIPAQTWQKQVVRAGTIQTNRIELITPLGDVRAVFGTTEGHQAALTMIDPDGKIRILLDPSGLYMGDLKIGQFGFVGFEGQTVSLNGSTGNGFLMLADESGKETVSLGVSAPSAASGQQGSAHLNLIADSPHLFLGRQSIYHTEIGTTDLLLPSTGATQRTSAASVVLFNDKGKVIWSAP